MTNNDKPVQTLLDTFSAASGIQWPDMTEMHQFDRHKEKWVYPFGEISDYAKKLGDGPDMTMRIRAVREAVNECRQRGIIVANPASIKSMAMHLLAVWAGASSKIDPTEADFLAYRRKLLAMGATVHW